MVLILFLLLNKISPAIRENRITTVQCLSGTGSLRVGAEFLAKHYHQVKFFFFFYKKKLCHCIVGLCNWSFLDIVCSPYIGFFVLQRTIYIPLPTWGNHTKVFNLAGLSVKSYRYYDPATRGLNFQGRNNSQYELAHYLCIWPVSFVWSSLSYMIEVV